MRILLSLVISLLLFGCQAQEQDQGTKSETEQSELQPYANVSVDRAEEMITGEEVVILDVRTDSEYNSGHIEGARQLDFYGSDFRNELEKLPKDQAYLVYCASGNRSGQAVEMMKGLGFSEAHNMMGGITAWKSKSKKTVQ